MFVEPKLAMSIEHHYHHLPSIRNLSPYNQSMPLATMYSTIPLSSLLVYASVISGHISVSTLPACTAKSQVGVR